MKITINSNDRHHSDGNIKYSSNQFFRSIQPLDRH
ncbi:hypothetical protein W822_15310 [Advenella kashmirensis W13003]|uniref:Uncharacterized protein n=1 Tax=Advenella kashmirensis W13003 TaxID=1424334 RepID=V8QR01_9BURK|nr:hypothetical protein W822_15310 [Advenella kashmirensis W13003]